MYFLLSGCGKMSLREEMVDSMLVRLAVWVPGMLAVGFLPVEVIDQGGLSFEWRHVNGGSL